MRLLLVRHGQSEWNAGRILQGQRDIALSALGRLQADALAPVVAGLDPDRSIASDLSRARETAERLGAPRLTLTPALRENDVGDWAGQRVEDLISADANGYRGWRAGRHTPPNGEAWPAFARRVVGAIEAAAVGVRCLLVVTHGGVIRAALQAYLDLEPARIIPVAPASLTALRLGAGDARLELFNCRPGGPELDAPD